MRPSICFVGNYPPRCCGIATFTQDLRDGVRAARPSLEGVIAAVSDDTESCAFPPEVHWVIREQERRHYACVAEAINRSGAELVSLQHEFGIYGGPSGAWIIDFLQRLRIPVITTCHTVLKEPGQTEQLVLQEIVRLSSRLVVMAEKGRELLAGAFDVPMEKIDVIPHGIPDAPITPSERQELRGARGWSQRSVLLTFGLLSPNKGLEQSIRALPDIVRRHPNVLYVVAGATHPNLVRHEGEAYRDRLGALVRELGMTRHVEFINRFIPRDELVRHIAAADVYLTPYLNEAQITSGTLAYAFGLGKPVVSTPYWHAAELLAGGDGVLVPFNDSAAITEAMVSLLADPVRMCRMAENAWRLGRTMTWPAVGARYLSLFSSLRRPQPRPVCASTAGLPPAVSLPRRLADAAGERSWHQPAQRPA